MLILHQREANERFVLLSIVPLLKVLMCGMNACGMNAQEAQWHGDIFILRYTSLKIAVLLHKTALVKFPIATNVRAFLLQL